MAMNKIRLEIKRLLATRGVGFQNSFSMGVEGFRRSQRSVRLSLGRFPLHSCCDSEEPGPKTQKIYFHPLSPACFHFDFLCYPSFYFSFFLFLSSTWMTGWKILSVHFLCCCYGHSAEEGKGKSCSDTSKWAH